MLRLGEIRNAKGAHRETKRLGRGAGSGQGQTAGKGSKGQLQRTGGKVRPGFEGGQMPHFRRLPKRGFSNIFRTHFAVINVGDLEGFKGAELSIEKLKESGLLKSKYSLLKILGDGDLKKALKVKAHAVSGSAKEKIKKAGGSVEILEKPKRVLQSTNSGSGKE